jgi:hypothetical protein
VNQSNGYNAYMTESPANHRRLWTLIAVLAAFFFTAALVLSAMCQASNCGGNSAALAACGDFATFLQLWEHRHPGEVFEYDTAGPERTGLAGANWLRSARFLAKRAVDPSGLKQIVVVCEQAYDNVPRGVLWKSPMAHAVGYSTGTTGLISPSEFAQVNMNDFVELRETAPEISKSK